MSAIEVLEAHVVRIEALNPALGAFVHLDIERARGVAAGVDRVIAAGRDPGPLAGVPFAVKEVEDVTGWPHTWASTLLADKVATTTSTQVVRLLAGGAVPVGLTASPEFATATYTSSVLHGVTRNPWQPSLTPGGSSGGSAAAVAAGMIPLATGSDSAGSLRIPAAFCGLVGFKGTYGRIPRGPGYVGAANLRNYGALTRTVRDTARFLDSVVGADEHDPLSLPHPGFSFEAALESPGSRGLRVAWSSTLGFARCEPAVARAARDAFSALVAVGDWQVVDTDVQLPDPALAFTVAGGADLFAALQPFMDSRSDEVSPLLQFLFGSARALQVTDIVAANQLRQQLIESLAELFDHIDLLLTPTAPTLPFAAEGPMPAEIDGGAVTPLQAVGLSVPFNLSGHPAISVPAGVVDGLPVGLQIVGRRHDDLEVLRAAAFLEELRPWPLLAPARSDA